MWNEIVAYLGQHPTAVVGIVSALILIRQLMINTRVNKYNIEQKLNDAYMDLLWRTAENLELAAIWSPLSQERLSELEQAKAEKQRYWFALSDTEMTQYRYVRVALELIQQVFEAKKAGVITKRSWRRWQIIGSTWTEARFYAQVVSDTNDSFTSDFRAFLDNAARKSDSHAWMQGEKVS